jgi:hypothetical protein
MDDDKLTAEHGLIPSNDGALATADILDVL